MPTWSAPWCTASIRGRASSSSAASARSAAAGAPSGARTASRPRSASMTATRTTRPCEQLETKIPLVVERHALIPDSGGAGRHRGGLGVEMVVRARSPVTFNCQIDRVHCKPWGLEGGRRGHRQRGRAAVRRHLEDRFPQRQGVPRHSEAGRRLPHALGRRRRLRPALGAAGRGRAGGCAPGLCELRGGGGALWCGAATPQTFAIDSPRPSAAGRPWPRPAQVKYTLRLLGEPRYS